MVVGRLSSQSKTLESWPSAVIDLVRAAIVDQPLEHIQVTIHGCISACAFIPRAVLAPEPLQHIQVTARSCTFACDCIPRAALAPQPLQCLPLTTPSCTIARTCIPWAALAPEPLQCLQVTTISCITACVFIPRTFLASKQPQTIQVPANAGEEKECLVHLETLQGFQPLQSFSLASLRCEEGKQRKKSEAKTRRRRDCEEGDSPAYSVMIGSNVSKVLISSCSRGRWPLNAARHLIPFALCGTTSLGTSSLLQNRR